MREFSGNTVALAPAVEPGWFFASHDAGYWDRCCRFLGFGEEGIYSYYAPAYLAGWYQAEMDRERAVLTDEQRANELAEERMTGRQYAAHIARRAREREGIEAAGRVAAAAEERAETELFQLTN